MPTFQLTWRQRINFYHLTKIESRGNRKLEPTNNKDTEAIIKNLVKKKNFGPDGYTMEQYQRIKGT